MPKSTGIHETRQYQIGRGIVYLSTDRDSVGRAKGYTDRGNAAELNCNIDEETLEHVSTRAGLAQVDREITISKKLQGTFIFENFTLDNLALFFAGTLAEDSVTGASVVGVANLKTIKKGQWFDLYKTANPASYPLAPDDRAYAISTVSIQVSPAGASLVEGTDYTVDTVLGRIFILPDAPNCSDDDDLDVSFDYATLAMDLMYAFKTAQILAAAKFRMVNPNDSNRVFEFQFHEINIKPEGDLSLIGNEWGQISLAFTAQANENIDATSPTLTIRTADAAEFEDAA